jgi:RNA polymerase sigma-70 factor (ECF subfamily)
MAGKSFLVRRFILMAEPKPMPTTHWSLVQAAGRKSSPAARQALETLCHIYWLPMYAYIRRRGINAVEAQDLTQSFFAELLDKDYLLQATPKRGRFRSFLLTACQHFLSKEWAKARAQKRGGGRAPLLLDFAAAEHHLALEPAAGTTPEQEYERQWAVALLRQVLAQLEQECARTGKGELFAALKPFLLGEHGEATYATAAQDLALTVAAVKMAASRLRRRYRELLREAIAQTVSTPEDVEDEIRPLFAALAH